jgi:hypothetical protein
MEGGWNSFRRVCTGEIYIGGAELSCTVKPRYFYSFVQPCGITVNIDVTINLSGRRNLRALWLDIRLRTIKKKFSLPFTKYYLCYYPLI